MKDKTSSFLALLLMTLLLQGYRAACGEGCLACSADSSNNFTCDICDAHNQYFRKPGSMDCEKIEIPNCEVASVDFLCFRCAPGYILDQVGGKCLKVHAGAVVENCYRYSQAGVCVQCKTDFYMSDTSCLPTTRTIVDCEVSRDAEECLSCVNGFFLEEKVDDSVTPPVVKQACVKITEKDNCLAYSLAECDVCKTGKIINRNYSLSAALSGSFLQNVIAIGRENQILTRSEGPVCVTPSASNCQTIKSSTGECEKCSVGYYKNNLGVCVTNPEDSVANCAVYTSPNNCQRCDSGYYISSNTCKEVTTVDFCTEYSPTTGSCTLCHPEYFLSSGACSVRTNIIIPQCTKLFVEEDKCETCLTGYKIWGDGLGCEIEIPQCKEYNSENTSDASLPHFTCKKCNTGYYPIENGKICQKQFVANCLDYVDNTNTCDNCLNSNFYKDTAKNKCIMKKVPNCDTPNSTNHDQCDQCRPGYYKDSNNKCHRYTVTNCTDKETDKDECKTCDLGPGNKKIYYLDMTDKRCKPYSLTNCSSPDPNKNECATCTGANFELDPVTKTCRKIPVPGCNSYDWSNKKCNTCADNGTKWFYDLTTFTCQRYSLEGCAAVNNNTNKNECGGSTCASGYYRKGTLCVPYDVLGCTEQEANQNKCKATKCVANKFWRDATSGLCKPYSIDISACTEPSTTSDECKDTKCKSGYSRDPTTKNCVKSTLPGCSTVDPSNSTVCGTCDPDFVEITVDSVKKCFPRTKFNCKNNSTSADECQDCQTALGYAKDNATGNCIRTSIHGCNKIKSDGTCETCNLGLIKVGSGASASCQVPLKAHCVTYDASGACTKCTYGYFPSGGNCSENTAKNCSIRSTTENKCILCNTNFYKNSTGVCTAVTKKNCFETDQDEDKCISCLPGYKFVTDDCTNAATVEVDSNCESSTDANGKCTKCKNGFFKYTTSFKSLKIENCIKFSSDDCVKCKNGYQLTGSSPPKSCVKETLTTAATQCLSKTDGNTTALSASGNCAECLDNSLAYLNSGVCTLRVTGNETYGCGRYETGADNCKGCPKDQPPFGGYDRTVCVKQKIKPTSAVTKVNDNCEAITVASLKLASQVCGVCKKGFLFSTPNCEAPSTTGFPVYLVIGQNLYSFKKTGKKIRTSPYIGAKYTIDAFSTTNVEPVECNSNIMSWFETSSDVSSSLSGDLMISFWDSNLQSYSFVATNPIIKCQNTVNNKAKNSNSSTEADFTNCGLATTLTKINTPPAPSNIADICLRCKRGYKGIVKKFNKYSDDVNLPTDLKYRQYSVECMTKTDEFEKRYHGLGYLTGETNVLRIKNDTCRNGLHLVYFLDIETINSKKHLVYSDHFFSSAEQPIEGCYELDNAIPNCQIHRVAPQNIAATAYNVKTTTTANRSCISCKPGYKMTINGTDPDTSTCTRIPNCDLSDPSKNKWMNACNTCKEGYSWNYASQKIEFHNCVWNNYVKGCAAVESGVCKLCHRGYDLYKGKCYNQAELGDSNCEEWGFGQHDLNTNSLTKNQHRYTAGFFYYFLADAHRSVGCGKCKPGYDAVRLTTTDKICHKAPFPLPTVENCEEHDIEAFDEDNPSQPFCSKCEHGYYLAFDDNANTPPNGRQKCIKWMEDRHIGCQIVNDDDECTACFDDYLYYTASKLCILKEDLEMGVSSSASLMFKEGRRPINFTNQVNIVIDIEESNDCKQYSHEKCIKCKDLYKIPLILGNKNVSEGVEDVWCVEFDRAGSYFPMYLTMNYSNPESIVLTGQDNYQYEEGVILITNSSAPDFCSAFNKSDPNCDEENAYFGCKKCAPGFYLPPDAGLSHCQPIEQANCIEFKHGDCSKCHMDYYLDSSFVCQRRTKFDCKEFSLIYDQCVECYDGFYFDSNAVCSTYTKKHCKTFFKYGDYCESCIDGYYFDEGECKIQDLTGCMTFYKTENLCAKCKEGFYLSSGLCKEYTVQNCSKPNPYEDSCIKCDKNTYMDDNRQCRVYSVNDCLEFHPHENKCASCPRNRYLTKGTGLCKNYTVQNCKLFSPVANKCDKCLDGSYPLTNGNCRVYSARNCKVFSPVEDGCLSCLPGFYRDGIKCKDYSVENCSIYDLTRDKCLDCLEGFYLDSKNDCKPYTGTGCKVRLRHDNKCSICLEGYFLNKDGECHPYTLERCAIRNQFEDKCLSCEKGTYLNNHRCLLYSVQNCRTYHPFKDWCESCRSGYYRKENGICEAYTLENCQVKHPYKNYCEKCEEKHYLGENYLCKPYTHSCKEYNNFSDHCTSCPETYHLTHDYKCVENKIENCKTYEANKKLCSQCEDGYLKWENHCVQYTARNCKTFKTTEDKCEECLVGAYYKNSDGACLASTAVGNCSKYKGDSDACETCNAGFYLIGTSECRKNPEGISKCIEYDNLVTCLRCDNGWYLENNVCKESTIKVPNCLIHIAEGKCGTCVTGMVLGFNNDCVSPTNGTCLTFLDKDNCKTCTTNFVLKKVGDVMNCVDSGIVNCSVAVPGESNNTCTKCVSGFVLKDNECKTPASPIPGCADYLTETECAMCNENYVLSYDKKTCHDDLTRLESGCKTGHLNQVPKCYLCSPGYKFDDSGNCVKCGGSVEGCDICGSGAQNCRVCKKGYYMTSDFLCIKYNESLLRVVEDDGSAFVHEVEGSARISALVSIMSVLVMLLAW